MSYAYKAVDQDLVDRESTIHRRARSRLSKSCLLLSASLLINFFGLIVSLRGSNLAQFLPDSLSFGDAWIPVAETTPASKEDLKFCPAARVQPVSPPAPINLWASLTAHETASIKAWLFAPEQNLNLTEALNARTSDNMVFMIEAYRPAKADALAYLANPTNTSLLPERYARVTIHFGGWKEPTIKDYLVGPLPVSEGKTTMHPLTDIYHRDDIPFNARGLASFGELSQFLAVELSPLADIMQELFGGSARGLPNDTLLAGMAGPFSYDGSFRRAWTSWRRNAAGSYLLPVDFYQYIDMSGTDASQWKVLKHVYHGQIFPSTADFVRAFHNGTLIRHPEQTDPTRDDSWTERKRIGLDRDLDDLPGPRSVSFAGLRFRVDKERQYVSWLGWGMYLAFDRDMGLSLWDIRFRGERIIYELSPQEAMAQYAGNDPMQASTAWLDRHFGMGQSVRDMLPYYDCPHEAIFLPASTFHVFGIIPISRAICIFEQDTGKPLSRHFGYVDGEFGATKSYVLTIRSTTTVGNYDYCKFDYMFYLDGTIEVRISASGYMQGGYWTPKQDGYGGRIRETSMGNLHDHVINYKVDLDIVGNDNSLLKTTTKTEEVIHPWLEDDWGQHVIQQKITKEYITNEDDAMLKHAPNYQGSYAVVNKDAKNRWGIPRGYAIHPGYNSIHNSVVGSKRLFNNANWARYNLAVSRRKETEPSSSSMWNLHLPGVPTVDFHKFFDGENIEQEDLVAWVNVGTHHLPQAEDSPHTKTNIASSSFVLTPLNYFDYDISMELRNAVLLHAPETLGSPYKFDDFGVKQDFSCVPESLAPFSYQQTPMVQSDGKISFANSPERQQAADAFLRVKARL